MIEPKILEITGYEIGGGKYVARIMPASAIDAPQPEPQAPVLAIRLAEASSRGHALAIGQFFIAIETRHVTNEPVPRDVYVLTESVEVQPCEG